MDSFIQLNKENLASEHICCAFSDKKCKDSYQAKKDWLFGELDNGYVFRKLNERAKVFIEYGPAENAWVPIQADGYLNINCFWVSGRYKKNGYGKKLLESAWQDAIKQNKYGLVTVVGSKKFHFMSDTKWLLRQGFEECERLKSGFSLLAKKTKPDAPTPGFKDSVQTGRCDVKEGIVAYYSNRCPFAEYHVQNSLQETAKNRDLPLTVIKLTNVKEAQSAPSPATIFSLFLNGEFITTDLSACMDSRFDKVVNKALKN